MNYNQVLNRINLLIQRDNRTIWNNYKQKDMFSNSKITKARNSLKRKLEALRQLKHKPRSKVYNIMNLSKEYGFKMN